MNIIDADCAIVTCIDLDHMEYLGPTREAIALEKAHVYRPAFCFQGHPEASPGPHDIAYLFDRFTALMAKAA